ncbi:NAD-dependent succinate-semialdehyde dehydrogenase [Bifidobacterium sp. ESL0763]|uniref:NAD-dependent succinate-semialdehyde dehydrogenase n=1 Tax=Bifidobacterium sp. ESL0763 TaxID=2983227 RepID=UPI0023FA2F62|nr:NAD-dependent succinate-semialdehyde dehydrogenase [Bifidobacterium sp. ESL0763]MDF7664253.1 NAD-dependent succinate-semialdehyde dehydrogenase [Bifidobacterium sp. ESL0763]
MTYQTINPYTNELVKTYPFATDEELETALAQAHQAFEAAKKQPIAERATILHAVAANIRKHADELVRTCVTEMGKLVVEAKGELEITAMIADWYADNAEEMLKPTPVETSFPGQAEVLHQAMGIVMAVEPWNAPFYQVMRPFAPAFMLGNTMILKHASNTPATAQMLCDVINEAGVPKGALTNMFLTYDQVAKAINDPRVRGVTLTGSASAGSIVAAEAGKAIKPSTLELGGMDPFVVLGDANMDDVNKVAPDARLQNAGQICIAAKRFIVMDSVYDEFMESLIDYFSKVRPGDPLDPDTTFAPLCTKAAKEKVLGQIDEAIKAGATVAYQYPEIDLPGQFVRPIILTDITPGNPAYDHEIFGPVATVYKVHSEQEAIDLANDSPYGLGGSVWSADPDHGARVAAQIDTGSVYVNNTTGSMPELPFGGVKTSGYGNELGRDGLLVFSAEKMVMKSARSL